MSQSFDKYVSEALRYAAEYCFTNGHEFVTPEHFVMGLLQQSQFREAIEESGGDVSEIVEVLTDYLSEFEDISEDIEENGLEFSVQLMNVINVGPRFTGSDFLDVPTMVGEILRLPDSYASEALHSTISVAEEEFVGIMGAKYDAPVLAEGIPETPPDRQASWKRYVHLVKGSDRDPLVGRDDELERTIRVLCRREKNNPLHVGHPGVGKTALVYGLAQRIERGEVPPRLSDARIYRLDAADVLAGTQYRGDMEKRLKEILDGASNEKGIILYIDEIHTLVGAGAIGNSSLDVSNILKPYLETGTLRFIGSTTHDEFNRHLECNRAFVRRFQMIDVPEPSIDDTISIVMRLRDEYEEFHGVEYTDEALEHAVRASASRIVDRYRPDKALDVIDEAGAYRETHPVAEGGGPRIVDKKLINEVIAWMCKIEAEALQENGIAVSKNLEARILKKVYGQPEAVRAVTEAVQMAQAGLTDPGKPMASLLFVGPTGVGKTELARVLAQELGVELVRFDMSEYAEKHTVAKLIGSPAGYVGYEDGGLLTDAIRRSPNCVLLLDEIEKAHTDIYNILLQVMDYARLSDNKGRTSDFRKVVLIMTSNAGAQYASRANVGFGANVEAGEAMAREVKRLFKPEFINRLSSTIVFHDMTESMASKVLDKKLSELQKLLDARKVILSLNDESRRWLLRHGYSREYGAREMERVIDSKLKPLLMREILYGALGNGGEAYVELEEDKLKIKKS